MNDAEDGLWKILAEQEQANLERKIPKAQHKPFKIAFFSGTLSGIRASRDEAQEAKDSLCKLQTTAPQTWGFWGAGAPL